jgi:hypothetical protein
MSLAGLIQAQGADVTVRRGTPTHGAGGATQRAWAEQIESTKLLITEITAERAQKMWGNETEATLVAWCDPSDDIIYHDGIIVTTGIYARQRFRVVADTKGSLGPARRALGLVLAKPTETFGLTAEELAAL